MLAHREKKRKDKAERFQRAEEQKRVGRERAIAERRKQEEQERRRQELMIRRFCEENGRLAYLCGIAPTEEEGQALDHQTLEYIASMSQIVDDFHSDIQQAINDNVIAERSVAYGRPAAAGGGLASFFAGELLLGLAFGALAVGARFIANDWKRMRLAEYQQMWAQRTSQFTPQDWGVFGELLIHKHPGTARTIASSALLPAD